MIDKTSNVSRVSSIGGSTRRDGRKCSLLSIPAAGRCLRGFGLGLALASGVQGFAQSANNTTFESFRDFMSHTQQASDQEFMGQTDIKLDTLMTTHNAAAPRPTFKVKDKSAFEEMRKAVLDRYRNVEVTHSFMLDNQHYDCVPIEEQPAVRRYKITKIATPPVLPRLEDTSVKDAQPQFDPYGNSTRCETNTIALHRLTLETLSRFSTLRDFYKKPGHLTGRVSQESSVPPSAPEIQVNSLFQAEPPHKFVRFAQDVDNIGANVTFNIWSPYVDPLANGEFSLTQLWVLNSGANPQQSEEAGWVVSPDMFGDELSHFFIYSTADGYVNTGSWNNAAGDFVQISDQAMLGSSFGGYSSPGGAQHEFTVQYMRDANNNWWLFRGGNAVGYYPAAFYGNTSSIRHTLEVGSETAVSSGNSYPPAGSGNWAAALYGYAAYMRNLFYVAPNGSGIWSNYHYLDNASCYNTAGPFQNGQGGNIPQNSPNPSWWTEYVFVGGPGGINCQD
jgi:Neprosin